MFIGKTVDAELESTLDDASPAEVQVEENDNFHDRAHEDLQAHSQESKLAGRGLARDECRYEATSR